MSNKAVGDRHVAVDNFPRWSGQSRVISCQYGVSDLYLRTCSNQVQIVEVRYCPNVSPENIEACLSEQGIEWKTAKNSNHSCTS